MMRRIWLLIGFCFLIAPAMINLAPVQAQSTPPAVQKGAGIIAYYQGVYPNMEQHLTALAAAGADWVSIYVTVYQDTINATAITYTRPETPSDSDIRYIVNSAHAKGLKVMLKPQIDLLYDDSHWRGQIGSNFNTEVAWNAWFASYNRMIAHYAALAEELAVEEFALGTELQSTTHRAADWRSVVATVRNGYSGPILYAANHSGEEMRITWWDAVDYIGLAAYYEVGRNVEPTVAALKAAWAPTVEALAALSARYDRPVIFVEIGYRSVDGALAKPWCYLCTGPVDLAEQTVGYQALLESVWHQPWFAGVYWWRWDIEADRSGACDSGYSPVNKPAENIVRSWYGAPMRTVQTVCGGPTAVPTSTPTPPATATPTLQPTATVPVATPTKSPTPQPTNTMLPTSTPTSPPTGSSVVLFSDQIAAGWLNWSWSTNATVQSTPIHSGNGALAVTHTSAWGGFYLRAPATLSLTLDHQLQFWARGSAAGQAINVWLVDGSGAQSGRVRVALSANAWTEVTVPLRNFGNLTAIRSVIWQDALGHAQPSYYLDEIRFQAGGTGPITTATSTSLPTTRPTNTPVAIATATSTPVSVATATNTPAPVATATSSPGGASALTIFAESLAAGWANWSWSSQIRFDEINTVHNGERSLAVEITGAWGGLFLGRSTALDVRMYDSLRFWIYGNGRAIDVKLISREATQSKRLRIVPPAGVWSEVILPLTSFGDFSQIGGVVWQDGTGAHQPRFYLDEIYFYASGGNQSGHSDTTLSFDVVVEVEQDNPAETDKSYLPIIGS